MPHERGTEEDEQETATENEKETEQICPECDGMLVYDGAHGEVVCEDCGLIVKEDEIDRGPEWRSFDPGERAEKSRVGAPTTQRMHDKGLSTVIDWKDVDASGTPLSDRQRQQMQRLRTWNERARTRDAKDRNLKQALGEIDRMASSLGLPDDVREMASAIYRRAVQEDLLPGRSIEGVATAALYGAARRAEVPRTIDEMAMISRIDRREFERAYRYIARELTLEIGPTDPTDYLPRFASELDVAETTERRAHELLEAAKKERIHSGRSPVGLAAAAIYAAGLLTDEEITQRAISDVTDVSEVTIRNRYKEILEAADEITPA